MPSSWNMWMFSALGASLCKPRHRRTPPENGTKHLWILVVPSIPTAILAVSRKLAEVMSTWSVTKLSWNCYCSRHASSSSTARQEIWDPQTSQHSWAPKTALRVSTASQGRPRRVQPSATSWAMDAMDAMDGGNYNDTPQINHGCDCTTQQHSWWLITCPWAGSTGTSDGRSHPDAKHEEIRRRVSHSPSEVFLLSGGAVLWNFLHPIHPSHFGIMGQNQSTSKNSKLPHLFLVFPGYISATEVQLLP